MRVCVNLHCNCLFKCFPQVVQIIPYTAQTSPGLSRVRESHVVETRIFDGIYVKCFRFNGHIEKVDFVTRHLIYGRVESIAKLYSIEYIEVNAWETYQ